MCAESNSKSFSCLPHQDMLSDIATTLDERYFVRPLVRKVDLRQMRGSCCYTINTQSSWEGSHGNGLYVVNVLLQRTVPESGRVWSYTKGSLELGKRSSFFIEGGFKVCPRLRISIFRTNLTPGAPKPCQACDGKKTGERSPTLQICNSLVRYR